MGTVASQRAEGEVWDVHRVTLVPTRVMTPLRPAVALPRRTNLLASAPPLEASLVRVLKKTGGSPSEGSSTSNRTHGLPPPLSGVPQTCSSCPTKPTSHRPTE